MKYFLLIILSFLMIGCEQSPKVRQYTEVIIEAPHASMLDEDPHAGLDMSKAPLMPTTNDAFNGTLLWSVPKGWKEIPSQGMRLASFRLINDPEAIDVSIVSLGGMAGGLQANLKRWLGQINITVDDELLGDFIKSSTDNVFDFSQLQEGEAQDTQSMIAAMLAIEDATVFVKMSGSVKMVTRYKKDFLDLVKSVRLK